MKWLLILMPIAIALEHFAPERSLLIFLVAGAGIIPLASLMAQATGSLAVRLGPGIGGLLNATFGNAAELIIALAALRGGLHDMVKASIAGTIIGNILFVLGVAMVVGGVRHGEQRYDARSARTQATMLTLAVIALIMPAGYGAIVPDAGEALNSISAWIAVALLLVYVANVGYTLAAGRAANARKAAQAADTASSSHADAAHAHHGPLWSPKKAVIVLAAVSLGIIWLSEILVGAVEPASEELGLSDAFTGVFVLAVIGGAAEQATAIVSARQNRMDLAMSIVMGASVQLALLVAPLLVLLSYVMGPHPMGLVFGPGLVLTIVFSVLITGQITSDGRTDWLRGVQLLAVYLILAAVFFYVPDASG
ncbi:MULTISPECIES: calcium/proton exchanger [unclassified Lysobacter]|uniref:calcium/proton exchanger n=1 Tax=unclassified Lysobacter TaxID=2635362 RepID=UPI001C2421C1|nr:calcium/proton exchanger [Lysobacter sp. MMG2]MBU8974572.1 calcium/proton exchanger [Lysobacter sp. MMG2]